MQMNGNLFSTAFPRSQALHKAAAVGLGIVILTLASKVQVPFWPVPMTLQTLAVLMIGATAGMRLGGATVLAWLGLGAVGAPVFATGAGLAYMAGPTGGYLAGFLLAAVAVGYLADKGYGRTAVSAIGMLLVGLVAIYALGLGWLSLLIGAPKAMAAGLLPFIPAEILKLALGTAILTAAWKQATR
jgi:biotin transport system substrate-specific component